MKAYWTTLVKQLHKGALDRILARLTADQGALSASLVQNTMDGNNVHKLPLPNNPLSDLSSQNLHSKQAQIASMTGWYESVHRHQHALGCIPQVHCQADQVNFQIITLKGRKMLLGLGFTLARDVVHATLLLLLLLLL